MLLSTLAAAALSAPLPVQESGEPSLESRAERGAVALTVRIDASEIPFSGQLVLEAEVRAPAEVEVAPLAFGERHGAFDVVREEPEAPLLDEGVRTVATRVLLTPRESGSLTVEPVLVGFRMPGDDAVQRLETEPLFVEVSTVLGAEALALSDLRDPAAPRAPARGPSWLLPAVGLVALAIAVWFLLRRRRGGAAPPPPSPREQALGALGRLLARGIEENLAAKPFTLELTGIVRVFIEQTTEVHAPEQTTEEFLREIQDHDAFGDEEREELAGFLEAADLVKFAAHEPGRTALTNSAEHARAFVEGFEPHRAAEPVEETEQREEPAS